VANIRLRYVKAYVDRHGKARHYVRKPGCKPTALPGIVGSDEFMAAYGEALANSPRVEVAATRTRAGSISAMIVGYLGSADFHNLASSSKRQYQRILEGLRRDYGDLSIATLARQTPSAHARRQGRDADRGSGLLALPAAAYPVRDQHRRHRERSHRWRACETAQEHRL
jgi:hypothetical protein